MRNKLIYILKHNPILQKLYVIFMSFVFRLWGKFLKIDENMVLFVSFMGTNFNDSPRVLYEYMQSHPEYRKYRCVWAFEHPDKYPGLETVKIDAPAYFKVALQAKYWITNTNIERGLTFKKKEQVYLNTWHGVALKHIGNDCPGRKDYDFRTLDYMCVSGRYDEKVFKSAFNVREETFLRCGMPRNDVLWKRQDSKKEQLKKKMGIDSGKKVLLYAPTWRESKNSGRSYDLKPPIHFDNWEKRLGTDYVILFRAHHITTQVLNVQFNQFVKDMSDYPDVNDLMIVADILITDYSAIAFDFCILERPILIFAYDYEEYLSSRGTYFDMEKEYPCRICKNENGLLDEIEKLDITAASKRTELFKSKFMEYGGTATEECIKKLFG